MTEPPSHKPPRAGQREAGDAQPAEDGPSPRPIDRLQRWMQAVITHPGGVAAGIESNGARTEIPVAPADVEQVIGRSRALGSLDRLAVYANAYYARLLECLREVFPVVCRTMGEEIFDRFAASYLQTYPSQSYTLNDLGKRFADFLEETRPQPAEEAGQDAGDVGGETARELAADWPRFVVDLARLEWTFGEVYDGPGMEKRTGLTAEELAAIPADRWPQTRLKLAPCVRLLEFRFPVNDYFTKMRDLVRGADEESTDDDDIAIPSPQETYLALSRRNYVVWRYPISRPQFELLSALARGETIEAALVAASANCELSDDELAAALHRWFADWSAHQFFAGVSLDGGVAARQEDPSSQASSET